MYPGFIDIARKENNQPASHNFDLANQVERIHHGLFQEMLKDLEAGKKHGDEPYYVCQVCGNTVEGEAPDKCPICGSPRSKFKKIA